MAEVTFDWRRFDALSLDELYEVLRFRQSIFVVEQRSPYPDLDGLDSSTSHLLLRQAGALTGYLRVAADDGSIRIGRIAVAPARRRQGLGRHLMEAALDFCRRHHPTTPIVLDAQLPLVPFYESFGFTVSGEPYDDFGVAHVAMTFTRRAR